MASLLGASQAEEPHENPDPKVICVLGAGSFGTAMAFVAARRGNKVRIYARNQEQVKLILFFSPLISIFVFFFNTLCAEVSNQFSCIDLKKCFVHIFGVLLLLLLSISNNCDYSHKCFE
jgi:hypothetical protein